MKQGELEKDIEEGGKWERGEGRAENEGVAEEALRVSLVLTLLSLSNFLYIAAQAGPD